MINWEAFGALELVQWALVFVLIVVFTREAYKRGRFEHEIDGYQEQLTANRAPKHARRAKRADAELIDVDAAGKSFMAALTSDAPWPGVQPRSRPAVTAVDIPPVIVPEPGTVVPLRPEPMRDSGAGTGIMAKLTDTGWLSVLKADTDRHIAQMAAEGDAYRKGISQ